MVAKERFGGGGQGKVKSRKQARQLIFRVVVGWCCKVSLTMSLKMHQIPSYFREIKYNMKVLSQKAECH